MFTIKLVESNKNHVNMKEINATALKLLVDYIYTGEIIITEENVQV
jgi:kelch-like protein 2/3